jgi:hypothetical protein
MQHKKSEAADGDTHSNASTIHSRAEEEIRKHKNWISTKDMETLKR